MNLFSSTKLKYFIAVMEEGSVSKACEKINISRTPLSRAISDLEFCLGFELFTRSKNGMIPNQCGIKLYNRVNPLYSELLKIENDLKNEINKTSLRIAIKISIIKIATMIYITDFLVFLSQHPLATFCGISAFFISCWTGYVEKHTLWDVFMSSIVSVLSALSILAILFKGNHYHLWLPLVGVIVGFIGPHKIRTVVLAILEKYIEFIKKYLHL